LTERPLSPSQRRFSSFRQSPKTDLNPAAL
jgi:hypothetical protein